MSKPGSIPVRSVRITTLVTLIALNIAALAYTPASAADDPGRLGRWSAPFWEGGDDPYDPPSAENAKRFPVAVALTVLPDGRLLYWNGLEGVENGAVYIFGADGKAVVENGRVRLLDLLSPSPEWTTSEKERGTTDEPINGERGAAHDLFCSDQKLLYDGTVLIAGGTRWDMNSDDPSSWDVRGLKEGRVFDPSTNAFENVDDMAEPRWYPSLVTLADGGLLVASGVRRLGASFEDPGTSFSQVRLTEIYDPATEKWDRAGMSEWSFPLYPRLHLLPDGKVFYGATGQAWGPFGEAPDQATWSFQRIYDPQSKTWSLMNHSRYGMRSGSAATLLRLEPPYEKADILLAGGTLGSGTGSFVGTTLSEVVRWTRGEGISNLGETKMPLAGLAGDESQLRYPRWNGVPVILPTGEVFLVNGADSDDAVHPGATAGVRTPELYDPERGTWTQMTPARRDRIYHHTAALLPDGRVIVGGNAPHPAHFFRPNNSTTRGNNFKDATFEIYEPPYLFRGDRPTVERVIPTRNGSTLQLILGKATAADDISEVVLVRMGANTHSMDGDMRAVTLEHSGAGSTVSAQLPKGGDGRILPPGPYYVFAMRDTEDGPVPSVAKAILVQPSGEGRVVARSI